MLSYQQLTAVVPSREDLPGLRALEDHVIRLFPEPPSCAPK
jgi:hypothetical protein